MERPVGAELVAEICRDFDIAAPTSNRVLGTAPPPASESIANVPPDAAVFGAFAAKRKRLWFFSS